MPLRILIVGLSLCCSICMMSQTGNLYRSGSLESFLKFEAMQQDNKAMPEIRRSHVTSEPGCSPYVTTSVKEPFFCHLETTIYERTNIWFKLRTGNDDTYMKMLRSQPLR